MTMNDEILTARMELLHATMERRGPGAETGDRLAQETARRVLFAIEDGRADRHAAAWRAFAKRRPTERRAGR